MGGVHFSHQGRWSIDVSPTTALWAPRHQRLSRISPLAKPSSRSVPKLLYSEREWELGIPWQGHVSHDLSGMPRRGHSPTPHRLTRGVYLEQLGTLRWIYRET